MFLSNFGTGIVELIFLIIFRDKNKPEEENKPEFPFLEKDE